MCIHRSRVLAARWIIPVSRPPIKGGWVRIEGPRIVEVGMGSPPGDSQDLGDVAILPALVNAHTHLEFSGLERPIGEPGNSLARWIGLVVGARGETTPDAKYQAICQGLQELSATGTYLAGEITTPPCEYPPGANYPQLVTFAEVLGLGPQRAEERLGAAKDHLASTRYGACSPHAPYSTSREAIEGTIQLARQYDRPLAMHVAEAPEERELLVNGSGALAEALVSLGVWRDGLFPWGREPFCELIDRLALAPTVLLVHGNDLNEKETLRLRKYPNVTVVYCPRTHHFFRFERHPVADLLASGVNVALGTDSRASNPDLNLWREVQFLLKNRSDLDPVDVVRMATLNGAKALRRSHLGAIQRDRSNLLGVVKTEASNLGSLYEDLAEHEYHPFDARYS